MCSWKKEEWRPTFWKLWNNIQLKIRNKELYLSLVLKHHSYIRSDVRLRRASECGGIWYRANCLFSLNIWWFLIGFYGLEILIHHILNLYVEQPHVTYAYEICFLHKWAWNSVQQKILRSLLIFIPAGIHAFIRSVPIFHRHLTAYPWLYPEFLPSFCQLLLSLVLN